MQPRPLIQPRPPVQPRPPAQPLDVYALVCRYIQALANNVTFVRYKELYAAAAELIGLMLKNLSHTAEVGVSLLILAVDLIMMPAPPGPAGPDAITTRLFVLLW